MEKYLIHHGILGQKWGIRRYQNKDGTLTSKGRKRYGVSSDGKMSKEGEQKYAKDINKLEKKTVNKLYKEQKKNGGHYILPFYRDSTGENFDKADKEFYNVVKSDKQYRELSKKAFDAEKKRLLAENEAVGSIDNDDYDARYEKYYKTKKAWDLENASIAATEAKDKRYDELVKDYLEVIKDAKIKDLNLPESAKKYVSDKWVDQHYDMNLDYNPDNFYESWVDKEKFK